MGGYICKLSHQYKHRNQSIRHLLGHPPPLPQKKESKTSAPAKEQKVSFYSGS